MIPKYRMWNRITSKLHHVDGLYFDSKTVQYIDEVGILRFIKFENTILMQSTGLHDKNGKEIFEGDVIEIEDEEEVLGNAKLTWNNERAVFMIEAINVDDIAPFHEILSDESYSYRVVGNIYENPELLEVE